PGGKSRRPHKIWRVRFRHQANPSPAATRPSARSARSCRVFAIVPRTVCPLKGFAMPSPLPVRPKRNETRRNLRPRLEPLEDRSLPAITWVLPAGGNWNDPANWLDDTGTHRLPSISAGDSVALPSGVFTVTNHAGCVDLAVAPGSTFSISGFAQLTVFHSASFGGDLMLSDGQILVGTDPNPSGKDFAVTDTL